VLFLQERDPVIVTEWHSSELAEIQEVSRPWERGGHYCLWNQAILPALTRKMTGKYFNIDFSAPVIEFTYESPVPESWNGQPALTQGRIWASFETENKAFGKWYNSVVRWIRKNFIQTSRWDTIAIQSVLRRTNGSEPAVCSFPIFDLR